MTQITRQKVFPLRKRLNFSCPSPCSLFYSNELIANFHASSTQLVSRGVFQDQAHLLPKFALIFLKKSCTLASLSCRNMIRDSMVATCTNPTEITCCHESIKFHLRIFVFTKGWPPAMTLAARQSLLSKRPLAQPRTNPPMTVVSRTSAKPGMASGSAKRPRSSMAGT